MNCCVISGNLCADPEVTTSQSGITRANIRVAVQREVANKDGKRECDFIQCVAWRHSAEYLQKYARKGDKVIVKGAVTVRSYEAQDGTKKYVTEINADRVEIQNQKRPAAETAEVAETTEYDSDQLPF